MAYEVEREEMEITGGQQDYYVATFGGFNFMDFNKDKSIVVNQLPIKQSIVNDLETSMVLFFTNIRQNAGQIEKEKTSLININ